MHFNMFVGQVIVGLSKIATANCLAALESEAIPERKGGDAAAGGKKPLHHRHHSLPALGQRSIKDV